MIIIAFSDKTSKILPRIFCRRMRHCAPIIPVANGRLVMHQFTSMGNVRRINLTMRDIRVLRANGWKFVYVAQSAPASCDMQRAITCVDLSKRVLNIKDVRIQTPYALYKHLTQ